MLQATLQNKKNKITETLYVLKGQPHSLLGKSACVKLNLIQRIETVSETSLPDYTKEFPQLFKGLSYIQKPYKINLKPDTKPVCIFAPRKIAHPLIPKVKNEIDRMLEEGVISPVREPTDWCSGIVVVPKPSGSVRIMMC